MSMWTAFVIIAGIIAVSEVLKARHRAHAGITTDMMGNGKHLPQKDIRAENLTLRREVEDLRERVKVLERIVTEDRNTRAIADEIESLRGK